MMHNVILFRCIITSHILKLICSIQEKGGDNVGLISFSVQSTFIIYRPTCIGLLTCAIRQVRLRSQARYLQRALGIVFRRPTDQADQGNACRCTCKFRRQSLKMGDKIDLQNFLIEVIFRSVVYNTCIRQSIDHTYAYDNSRFVCTYLIRRSVLVIKRGLLWKTKERCVKWCKIRLIRRRKKKVQ